MRTPNAAYATSQRDPVHFKRVLTRAVLLPLVLTALLSVLFLWQIGRLLAASQWVDHTDEVIAQAPLTAVVGWSRMLRAGKLDPENRERALGN